MDTQKPIKLGLGTRPTDSAALESALRMQLLHGGVTNPANLQLTATLDGDDIALVNVDASGVVVRSPSGQQGPDTLEGVAASTPGVLREVHVTAAPIQIDTLPVTVQIDAANVPFTWVESGSAWGIEGSNDQTAGTAGSARIAVEQARLTEAIGPLTDDLTRAMGVAVRDVQVSMTSNHPRHVRIDASANVKKGIIGAPVRAVADVDLEGAVLTVRELDVSSTNPLASALIGAFSGKVQEFVGQRVDLNEYLPLGLKLQDAQIDVGPEIVLTASVGT